MRRTMFVLSGAIMAIGLNAQNFNGVYNSTIFYIGSGVPVKIDSHYFHANSAEAQFINEGDLYLSGDWTNENPNGAWVSGNGTVHFVGDSQRIKGPEFSYFSNVSLEGTGAVKLENVNPGDVSVILRDTLFFTSTQILHLNSRTLQIDNSSPNAIQGGSDVSYIYGETQDLSNGGARNLSIVKWQVGSNTGTYTIPFGSDQAYYPLTYEVTTAGTGNYVAFSTYATTDPGATPAGCNNRPLPGDPNIPSDSAVTNTILFNIEFDSLMVNRFWRIYHEDYTQMPVFKLTFTLSDDDVAKCENGTIDSLILIAWNAAGQQWREAAQGTNALPLFESDEVQMSAMWWTLAEPRRIVDEAFVPNIVTPNGDNVNDYATPAGVPPSATNYVWRIYNRWGELVFESTTIGEKWEAICKGQPCPQAVYAYVLTYTMPDGKVTKITGNITVVK
ncbi:MAG: gliding motility-associated C-terminal domain-containing protein [Chlorobi bacterium]|nr:gliding motility-associated C-terminal domain-containing protein [Chlorobiota bacterium]